MAKATLPTNFKDDILADAMGNKRRYNVIENSDGTISLEDATAYTQVGSTFGAAQINATNAAANASADASKIIDDYETLIANTQAGYMAGALAVKALNSNLNKYYIDSIYSMVNGSQHYFANFTNVKASKLKIGAVDVDSTSGIYLYFGAVANNNFIDLISPGEWDISAYNEIHFRAMGNSGDVYIGDIEFVQ